MPDTPRCDISICAVTFRRPRGLARLLESLARLKIPPDQRVEIVLVDNDPDGSSFRAPDRAESAGDLPIRWHHEVRGNISHARNACVAAARGSWIAFVDDDEAPHEDWIAAYLAFAEREEADAYFGPVIPRLEVERESWLPLYRFITLPRHPTGTVLSAEGAFAGNALIPRSLLRKLPFDPRYGRTGGEDVDFALRALDRGARFLWCDEARIDEFVTPERHSARYLVHRAVLGACAWSHIERSRSPRSLRAQQLAALTRVAAAALALPIAALAGRPRGFAALLLLCQQLGRLWGLAGRRVERDGR